MDQPLPKPEPISNRSGTSVIPYGRKDKTQWERSENDVREQPYRHQGPYAQRQQMSNSSSITQFLLLALADTRELQLLHFWLSLGIYLAALMANGLIITTVVCNHHLHTTMYVFLLNLSLLGLGSISTTVPKAMANSLWDTRDISYAGCAAQLFLIVFFLSAEYFLLTVMAYDRSVAICQPLHYGTLLGSRACVHMAAAAWASGFLHAVLHTANTLSLPLCHGNALGQVFCEIPQILKLSCSHTYLREVGLIWASAFLYFGCFVSIVLSYVQIFRAVLRIPSEQGRHKAFSTCLPHLAVVSLFLSTATFAYLKPPSISSPSLDLVVAVLYSVVPPAVNPLIYSMRNQELKDALKKLMQWKPAVVACVQVTQLVEFLIEHHEELFGEDVAGLANTSAEELPASGQKQKPLCEVHKQRADKGLHLMKVALLPQG
ncbi:olfactory receptor 14C36-like [Falco peregrinus]|uniref:olfactory receptor 14C36-like n=1 Tax=Falco peregrinus TaxID=8954 RepID=UPI002479CE46|nr:olfactory receptor 14C36-like [Falco peregrinus]